ncbi:hypothetical protein [Clostridium sp. Marseille-P3244]|uniref:hypothetical protein n=1 Tax=Clostridium sp. Marseille-P3244 TaxID=1871020 RepID=UPI0009309C5B|nr:hypothetical protein [Clostridium sp. Marseille-P3244]
MKECRKKRRILLVGILLILIILAVFTMYGKHLFQEKENIIKTVTYKDDFKDFLYVEEESVDPGNTAVVTTADTTFNLRYGRTFTEKWTCLIDAVYCRDTEKDIITDIEKAEYSIYDLVSGERIRTIDIKTLAEQKAPNQVMARPADGQIFLDENGSPWVWFALQEKDKQDLLWNLEINLETGETKLESREVSIEKSPEDQEQPKEDSENDHWGIFRDDIIGLLKINGFFLYSDTGRDDIPGIRVQYPANDQIYIETSVKNLPENNEVLYGEFPGLKDYEGSEDDIVSLYLQEELTDEEVMRLLMEDGEEISFEGCVLPADESNDDKEHEIHSFEEFYQWKK